MLGVITVFLLAIFSLASLGEAPSFNLKNGSDLPIFLRLTQEEGAVENAFFPSWRFVGPQKEISLPIEKLDFDVEIVYCKGNETVQLIAVKNRDNLRMKQSHSILNKQCKNITDADITRDTTAIDVEYSHSKQHLQRLKQISINSKTMKKKKSL